MPWKLKAFGGCLGLQASTKSPPEAAATPSHSGSGGEPPATKSLWDRAYDALQTAEPRLVEKYESLLNQEPLAEGPNPETEASGPSNTAKGGDPQVDSKILRERRSRSDRIVSRSLEDMDNKPTKYQVFGREFTLRDQVDQAVVLIQGLKSIIQEAIRASPEASLAWAGVCVILPLLTNPKIAEDASKDGFTYVTSRMRFYIALQPLLLPKDRDGNISVPDDLKTEFESHLVDLYRHILEFQFRCVLRFYSKWLRRISTDILKPKRWEQMLGKIRELEALVAQDAKRINDPKVLEELKSGTDLATRSLNTVDQLLSVENQQLQVNKDMLLALNQILDELRHHNPPSPGRVDGDYVSGETHNRVEAQHVFAKSSSGLGGKISKSDDRLQISGGDGGATFVSWKSLQNSGQFSAWGGDGGDATMGSNGLLAGQGRGGGMEIGAKRALATQSEPRDISELKSGP